MRFLAFMFTWFMLAVIFGGLVAILAAVPVAFGASPNLFYVAGGVGAAFALFVCIRAAAEAWG